jgi:hypothetical protein
MDSSSNLNLSTAKPIAICVVLGDFKSEIFELRSMNPAAEQRSFKTAPDGPAHGLLQEPIFKGLRSSLDSSDVKLYVAQWNDSSGLKLDSMDDPKCLKFGFDVVIAINVFSSIHVLAATTAMERILNPGGNLVVLNDSGPIQASEEIAALGLSAEKLFIENIKALAMRQGFALDLESLLKTDVEDWGSEALMAANSLHLPDLIRAIAQSVSSCWELFRQSGHNNGVEDGQVLFLSWTLVNKGSDYLGYLKSKDLMGYEALFKECFEIESTPGLWDYKFGEGGGFSLGLYRDLEPAKSPTLIAHYAGLKREVLFFGKPEVAIQVGDVMVDTRYIKSLSRKGPFFFITSTFLEHHIGYGRDALLGFGFPNEKHLTIAKLLGFYDEVDRFVELSWGAKAGRLPFWYKAVELNQENFFQYSSHIDRLWGKMAKKLNTSVLGVRNSQYIKRRFFERPGKTYRLMLILNSITHRAVGLLVFNSGDEKLDCMDFVADPSDIATLVGIARQMANSTVQQVFSFRITLGALPWFQKTGFELKDLSISIPANTWTQGPSVEVLKSKWWLSAGDMDFV